VSIDAYSIESLKEFNFRVEIDGLPIAAVQEFNPGTKKIGIGDRAGGGLNHDIKEAGRITFEHATLKTIVPMSGSGRDFWENWFNLAQNAKTGVGSRPSVYKKNFSIYNLAPDGTPSRVWEFYGAWVSEYKPGDLKAKEEKADLIEEVQITYDRNDMRIL
jgi:phage tail-like protein